MARKVIAVEEAIADSIAKEATRENKTVYGLTNELLEGALKVCKEGGSPKEIFPSWNFGRTVRETDALPVPGTLVEKMMMRVYASDSKWLLSEVYGHGVKIGSYLRLRYPNLEDLVPRLFELQTFLPIKRLEFEEAGESAERVLIAIHILGAGPSLEATECAEQFVRGLISQYPYRLTDVRLTEGIIEAKVEREEGGAPQKATRRVGAPR